MVYDDLRVINNAMLNLESVMFSIEELSANCADEDQYVLLSGALEEEKCLMKILKKYKELLHQNAVLSKMQRHDK